MQNLFSSQHSSQNILPTGTYSVELVTIREGKSRSFENKPPKPTITFCFKEVESKAPVNRTVAATLDSRGRLLEFVRQLAGSQQPTPEQIADGEKFTLFLQSLITKRFKASIAPSANGRFSNIVSISRVEEQA
jgi:hypothetical protein